MPALDWIGKQAVLHHPAEVPFHVLRYDDALSVGADSGNLVVEYKGEDRWSNADSTEKRNIGELWAKRSGGRCLFVMPKGEELNAIGARIRARA